MIIGQDDLEKFAPIAIAKDAELNVVQFEGKQVESVGLIKMDFLGLKTLSIIKDALENIEYSKGIKLDIDSIPLDDAATYDLYSRGETTGLFQFESPGMKKIFAQSETQPLRGPDCDECFVSSGPDGVCNVTITADDGEVVTYALPYAAGLRIKDGDVVAKGDQLTEGALSPHEVLRIRGLSACHNYLIREVQKVYRQQGVDTNDKHIEVIIRQMMRKVRGGRGRFRPALRRTIDIIEFWDAEKAVRTRMEAGEKNEMGEDLRLPTCTRLLMGITKASLATDSFLSAASFQETTKVLTEAAIKGKVDHLLGLKENVIIGKLIPAGSGLAQYRKDDPIDENGNLITAGTAGAVEAEPLEEPEEEGFFRRGGA